MARIGILAGPAVAVMATGAIAADSGVAAASCNPGRPNNGQDYHIGQIESNSGVDGVSATITAYQPYVYPGFYASTAWTMLQDSSGNWAQVGTYATEQNNSYYWWRFVQYTTAPNQFQTITGPGPTPGSNLTYQVTYGNGSFTYSISTIGSFSLPASFTPTAASISGEIDTEANQVPGGVSDPVTFNSEQIKINGTWKNYSGQQASGSLPAANYKAYSATEFQISDSACPV